MFELIIAGHFIADWLLQSRHIATTKSTNIKSLIIHITIYGLFMSVPAFSFFGLAGLKWILLNTVLHGLWDWNFYRIMKRVSTDVTPDNYYEKKAFWDSIAVDQTFHLVTLFATLRFFI